MLGVEARRSATKSEIVTSGSCPTAEITGIPEASNGDTAVLLGRDGRESITAEDLVGLPLFCSEQSWKNDIGRWCGERLSELSLEGSFRLAYNASMFVLEGLGYQLSFRDLVNTSPESGLIFRPLSPLLETRLFLIWNRYQTFTPAAERFLAQVRKDFKASK